MRKMNEWTYEDLWMSLVLDLCLSKHCKRIAKFSESVDWTPGTSNFHVWAVSFISYLWLPGGQIALTS